MTDDDDFRIARMGWRVMRTMYADGDKTIREHVMVKDRRRLSYTITTTRGIKGASMDAPVCEILQEDGSWLQMTWREWAAGMPEQDYPFPFPET